MKTSGLSVWTLFAGCIAVAACSQATEVPSLQSTPSVKLVDGREAIPSSYGLLYSFHPAPDGNNPEASLVDVDGTLYGTTLYGGAHTCNPPKHEECGTVFSITTAGVESVLHSFGNAKDGGFPSAAMNDVGGTLYGTTPQGGKHDAGTVFSITTVGAEKVLYSFANGADGYFPSAALTEVGGALYGTTHNGGAVGDGTVFSIKTTGTENVLYSFGGRHGAYPSARLNNGRGTLYSTTDGGGRGGPGYCNLDGCGTVYSVSTSGTENVLHRFGRASDGWEPEAGLVEIKDTLYGTTWRGGAYDDGTVFSITTRGRKYRILYSFRGGADGTHPSADLIDVNGTLYGTTNDGGAYNSGGTVFRITTAGVENVLHAFGNGSDGVDPAGGLIDVHGTLYGTTARGGAYGNGTVFSQTP